MYRSRQTGWSDVGGGNVHGIGATGQNQPWTAISRSSTPASRIAMASLTERTGRPTASRPAHASDGDGIAVVSKRKVSITDCMRLRISSDPWSRAMRSIRTIWLASTGRSM